MGKPRQQRQKEIIASTLDLCAERGINKITTQVIADRTGVAQATIFKHFKDRDSVFEMALNWLTDQMFSVIESVFESSVEPTLRLQRIIRKQLHFASNHRALPRILFSDRLHSETTVLREIVQNVMNRYIKALSSLIEEGISNDQFNSTIDVDATSKLLASTIQGTLMRWSISDFQFDLQSEAKPLYYFFMTALDCSDPAPWEE